jgi:hypothetical protein
MNPARGIAATGVADTGWYRDRIGSVDVAFVYDSMTEASFDHFLAEVCRSIDECADDERVAMFLEVRDPALMDSRWRKRMADALKARAQKLGRTRPAYAMVTSSIMVRSALKVMHWAAPPPYPHSVVGSIQEGCEFIARHVPGLDARELQIEYERRRADLLAGSRQG